jgi:NitT/TauT family transport system ATP-binding protein
MNTTNTDIKVTNLSIKFQKNSKSKSFFALDSVNFEVKRGDFSALLALVVAENPHYLRLC